ncbi:MAG: putative porin [Candidatus Omnitrophica bacterium]|nr:putative porin [Candidatus Omnitrophota bacterium]
MRKLKLVWLISILFVGIAKNNLFAATTQVDALIEKLVAKGILNRQEAIELKAEIAEDEKILREEGLKQNLPQWIREMKLKGDFRLRYQHEKRKGSNLNEGKSTSRDRGRFRLRLGAETKVNDQTKLHFGLASGSDGDPRSTNQTFQDTFSKKSIWIDYVYAEYMPWQWLTLLGGRMKNPIWEPADMLWDTDINPEGIALKLNGKLNPKLSAYVNNAIFILEEYANTSDPWMYVLQPGLKWSINDGVDLNLATTYYGFKQVKGATLDWSTNKNTAAINGGGNFNSIHPAFELGIKEPFSNLGLNFPYFSLFGEYIHNLDAMQSKNGYAVGFRLGHKKINDKGQWQTRYTYTLLETYAWPDVFPDSDRYSGRTGIRGHEILLAYGLSKNLSLEFDYYRSDLTSTSNKTENLFQVDLNFKF